MPEKPQFVDFKALTMVAESDSKMTFCIHRSAAASTTATHPSASTWITLLG
jgi:hypothetical protein